MSRQAGTRGPNGPVQLYVSCSPADERWAAWITWESEAAGYRALLPAWDFVPGTNFIDFMDRGLSEAAAVVAVLSRHYVNSTYSRLEWQAALRAGPGDPASRLIAVRVEECPLEGLLATITYIDMVGVTDPRQARDLLLSRIGHVVAGRAKREVGPPQAVKAIEGQVLHAEEIQRPKPAGVPRTRRAPVSAPAYPPAQPHLAKPQAAVTRRVTQVRFGRAGEQLATIGNDGIVRLWHPRTGQQLRQITGTDRLISVLFSPVGDRIATVSNDGGVYLWNAASGAYEQELNVETDHLWAEAFGPAGDVLATANDDDRVRLWDCTTGRHLGTFAEHSGRVRSIAFSPDGRMLATACDDRAVRLWDVSERTCLATLTGHTDRVCSVMFSPDGAVLASASNDGTARLWNVASATQIRTLTGHQGRLWSAAFNSNGTLLATGGDDPTIRLWDPRTGAELRTLAGHTQRVWSVAFSPDGTLLASAGDDGTARLWNTAAGEPSPLRLTLLGLPQGWAALAPDGRYKQEGDVTAPFWHVVGMCRVEPGELDSYLTTVRRVALDEEF